MRIDPPEPTLKTPAPAPAQPTTGTGQSASFAAVLQAESAHASRHTTASSRDDTPLRSSASEEFRDYMAKSDAEKVREAILKEMGLTEEEFEALPPEEQLAIEQKIVERLKEKTGVSDTGFHTHAAREQPD